MSSSISLENISVCRLAIHFHCHVVLFIKSSRMCQFIWYTIFFPLAASTLIASFHIQWVRNSCLRRVEKKKSLSESSKSPIEMSQRNFNKLFDHLNSSVQTNEIIYEMYMSNERKEQENGMKSEKAMTATVCICWSWWDRNKAKK